VLFKNVLFALGMLALVGGITAIAISLPERAWNEAMLRLSARLQLEAPRPVDAPAAEPVHPSRALPAEATRELDRPSASASKVSTPEAHSPLDRTIDLVIELLRRLIGTRSFPRTALKVLGLILILAAVACFVMGSLIRQGEVDNEGVAPPRVGLVANVTPVGLGPASLAPPGRLARTRSLSPR
jgi:hypothetical protein